MPRLIPVAILCWAVTSSCLGDEVTDAALAEDAGQIEDSGASQGLVIELDESVSTEPGATGEQSAGGFRQRELADSDVELIIGGQGKDGIAWRGRLKKEE